MDTKYKNYELFLKSIPLISGFLVVAGVLKTSAYYIFFRISLLDFMTIGEILKLPLRDSVIISISFLGGFLYAISTLGKTAEKIKKDYLQTGDIGVSFLRHNRRSATKVYFAISLTLMVFLMCCIVRNTTALWFVFLLVGLICALLIGSNEYMRPRAKDQTPNTGIRSIIAAGCISVAFMVAISMADAISIKYTRSESFVVIEKKDEPLVITGDSLVYVGKSDHYTYLFNKTLQMPEIISTDGITKMIWKPNK